MTVSTAPVETVPGRRWSRIALVVSLAVNLLLIGAAVGAMYRFRTTPPVFSSHSTNLIGYVRSLPPARRDEIWTAVRPARRTLKPLRSEVRAARVDWRNALAAQPFDSDRFAKAQARVFEAETKARAEAQHLFVAIAASLNADERAAFAKWHPGDRPWRGRRGGKKGGSAVDGTDAPAAAQRPDKQ